MWHDNGYTLMTTAVVWHQSQRGGSLNVWTCLFKTGGGHLWLVVWHL